MSLFGKKDDAKKAEYFAAESALTEYVGNGSFKEPADIRSMSESYSDLFDDAGRTSEGILSRLGLGNRELKERARSFRRVYSGFGEECRRRNLQLAEEAYRSEDICPVEGIALDSRQLEAIYTDVSTRLILSGAGSGKTTTIVGMAKHLFASGIDPERVLFISFTNNSVSELRVRIRKETGRDADVKTFHRLGLRIISECTGRKPHITHIDLNSYIYDYLISRDDDRSFKSLLARYTILYQQKEKDQTDEDIEGFNERYTFTADDGTKVRSNGELDIANHLHSLGIPYIYEDDYPVDTSDREHSQYHPDFHIKGTKVYIEFFGTDRNGNVAAQMTAEDPEASKKYNDSIAWKRETHLKNGTVMIETYSYQRSEGSLLSVLDSELEKAGVFPSETHTGTVLCEAFGGTEKAYRTLANEFSVSISLIKGTGKPWSEAYPKGDTVHQKAVLSTLERILHPMYVEYEKLLKDRNEIDFQDMLVMSADLVSSGRYCPEIDYMVVDEYQDVSPAAYRLIRAMRDSRGFRLLCVGDDWQSIYRFNGSDVSYIMDFERYWGPSAVFTIERTYRYSGQLLSMSSRFIMDNPRQIKKRIAGPSDRDTCVVPLLGSSREEMAEQVLRSIERIPEGEDVLLIGRYNHDIMFLEGKGLEWKKDTFSDSQIVRCNGRPDLKVVFRTAHASKGLQADNVFILNNRCGRFGFPSESPEAPIISTVLEGGSKEEDERRLYYVAMTRAKKRLFLVIPQDFRERSCYVNELFPKKRCPDCGGDLVLRKGRYGCFYGCTNYKKKGCRHIENIGNGFE